MDAWADSNTSPFLAPATSILKHADPLFARVQDAKKSVQSDLELASGAEADSSSIQSQRELILAVCENDMVTFESIVHSDPQILRLSLTEMTGYPLLVFAIVFDHISIAETLLSRYQADPDAYDTEGPKYTPLMWAVHFENLPMVKLLLDYQADPYLAPKDDGKNAVSLVTIEMPAIYEFFKGHNLFSALATKDGIYNSPMSANNHEVDNLADQIRISSNISNDSVEEELMDEEAELAYDTELVQTPTYDYDKILPEQCIKFSDSDIPSLLDYIFNLRINSTVHQHETKIPAAILFQLMRYSHDKVDSADLTDFLFDCFVARLRSVTNTKSGVFNMAITTSDLSNEKNAAGGAGDIVLISYWLSVLQFLHFYFTKGRIYHAFPRYLQELINLTQSLVATLSFSINSRLNLLVDDCLINYTNLVDVSNALYAKDWNLFKNKNKKHPSSYDDILDMLYPPKEAELMRPSPVKYIQVLGALDYVLKLHAVDPLLRFQTYSQVFYYINATLFNRVIANSKNCSRVKAIQIRLNISALEDWLRSHNYHIYRPDRIGGLELLLNEEQRTLPLTNVLTDKENTKDIQSLSFLYKSLYYIGKTHLLPTIELLQWLQVMSGIKDEESLVNTINEFSHLNYYQIFKVANKLYRYEVDEPKLAKPLVQYLKSLMNEQGENLVSQTGLHYMTQSTFLLKEVYIYLNPNYVFAVTLPNLNELIVNYGAGLGGVKLLRAKKYQPLLPVSVLDDVDEILTQNKDSVNDTYDYEDVNENAENASQDYASETGEKYEEKTFKGAELFKQMEPPLTLAHKEWGAEDIDSNPW